MTPNGLQGEGLSASCWKRDGAKRSRSGRVRDGHRLERVSHADGIQAKKSYESNN